MGDRGKLKNGFCPSDMGAEGWFAELGLGAGRGRSPRSCCPGDVAGSGAPSLVSGCVCVTQQDWRLLN